VGTVVLEQDGVQLTVTPEVFLRIAEETVCPLQNSFLAELVELRQKRSRLLDAQEVKTATYAALDARRITQKEAFSLFAVWKDIDLTTFDAVDEEFETLYRALNTQGEKALNHAAKGCGCCRGRS
jgi:hypothetical protein